MHGISPINWKAGLIRNPLVCCFVFTLLPYVKLDFDLKSLTVIVNFVSIISNLGFDIERLDAISLGIDGSFSYFLIVFYSYC